MNWDAFFDPNLTWRVPTHGDTATLSDAANGTSVTLSASTGLIDGLTVENGFDLDTSGFLLIVDEAFSAQTTIRGAGSTIVVDELAADPTRRGFDTDLLDLRNGGQLLHLSGGTMRSTGTLTLRGNLLVDDAVSTIETPLWAVFEVTSQTTLDADLSIVGNPIVTTGATFSGAGAFINAPTSHMQTEDVAGMEVMLRNEGELQIGDAIGRLDVKDFEQTATWTAATFSPGKGGSAAGRCTRKGTPI